MRNQRIHSGRIAVAITVLALLTARDRGHPGGGPG